MAKYSKWYGWKKDKSEDKDAINEFLSSGGEVATIGISAKQKKEKDNEISLSAKVAELMSTKNLKK
jgi:hypothetical protein